MNLQRAGALTITAAASLALFPTLASATQVSIGGACELRDGKQALVMSYQAQGWPLGSRLDGTAARDGAVFFTGGRPTSSALDANGYSLPEGLEFVSFLPSPQPSVHATAHIAAYLPGAATAYREARLDAVYACPALPVTQTPPGTEPAQIEPLPRVVVPRALGKVRPPQKPRCALPEGAGRNWYIRRGCDLPKRFLVGARAWKVTGERRSQAPSPASIVSGLLYQVPQLAGDVPFASSMQQSAGGRSASGGVSAAERGRLVPANIPGHPWTSKTTGPRRGVAVSVIWLSGRKTVRVLYSASRGQSTTTVSVR